MTISFYFIDINPFPRFYSKNSSKHLANKHAKPPMVLQQIQELFMALLPMQLLPGLPLSCFWLPHCHLHLQYL
jgi:hypothetical protein